MKKLLFAFLGLALIQSASGQILLGGGPLYGDDIDEFGINIRAYTFPNKRICFGPELTLFPKHNATLDGEEAEIGLYEINFNGHFIFEVAHGFGLYPLTGLNFSREIERVDGHDDEIQAVFGVNLGGGAHFELKNVLLYAEYDRLFSELRQNSFTIGILFKIGFGKEGEETH